jgi:eukaryotic-like serine/threonine-protein kinase
VLEKLQPGDPVRMGPYRLTGVLGAGGMGRVLLGWSAGGRPVAVKIIRPELASDPEFRARFRREVAAARTIGGLYTALVIDADTDGPVPWLATAYVDGPSLAEAVSTYGPLPTGSVLALAAGLAEALAAVHAMGLVHRDLKPSNVLLASDGPRVIDFGIARAADSTTLTSTGQSIGSPGFLSPEQALGNEVGAPSDIFSLGALLAFAASGNGPFGVGLAPALIYRVVHEPPTLEGVPAQLRPLIGRCLAKEPGARPTANDLLADLADVHPGAQWLPPHITSALAEFAVGAMAPGAATHERTAASATPPLGAPSPALLPADVRPEPAAGVGADRRGGRPLWRRPSLLVPVLSAAVILIGVSIALATTLGGPKTAAQTATNQTTPVRATSSAVTKAPAIKSAAPSSKPSSASPKPKPTHSAVGPACSFEVGGAVSCDSMNPRVSLYANFGTDTSACSFTRDITWGDGKESVVFVQGGPAGPKYVTSHTYSAPGTYLIYFGSESINGPCTDVTPTYTFKLRSS